MTDDDCIAMHFADGMEKKLNGKYPFMVFMENGVRSAHRGNRKMWQSIERITSLRFGVVDETTLEKAWKPFSQ
jgi:hypothetical protein